MQLTSDNALASGGISNVKLGLSYHHLNKYHPHYLMKTVHHCKLSQVKTVCIAVSWLERRNGGESTSETRARQMGTGVVLLGMYRIYIQIETTIQAAAVAATLLSSTFICYSCFIHLTRSVWNNEWEWGDTLMETEHNALVAGGNGGSWQETWWMWMWVGIREKEMSHYCHVTLDLTTPLLLLLHYPYYYLHVVEQPVPSDWLWACAGQKRREGKQKGNYKETWTSVYWCLRRFHTILSICQYSSVECFAHRSKQANTAASNVGGKQSIHTLTDKQKREWNSRRRVGMSRLVLVPDNFSFRTMLL